MRDDPDSPRAIAQDLMRRATICDLKASAQDLAGLLRGLEIEDAAVPAMLSIDPIERARQLLTLYLSERNRSRRLIKAFAGD